MPKTRNAFIRLFYRNSGLVCTYKVRPERRGRQICNRAPKRTKLLKQIRSTFVKHAEEVHHTNMTKLRVNLRDQRGFNLIELMIVIAIIGLLIGVGSYAWSSMIKSGNETAAAQSLDKIRVLQAQYAAKHRGNFANFDELVNAVGLDERFKGERPVVNGYIYTLTVEASSGTRPAFYSIAADPQVSEGVTATGGRHFYTDSSIGTIKGTDENRPAKADDPSI